MASNVDIVMITALTGSRWLFVDWLCAFRDRLSRAVGIRKVKSPTQLMTLLDLRVNALFAGLLLRLLFALVWNVCYRSRNIAAGGQHTNSEPAACLLPDAVNRLGRPENSAVRHQRRRERRRDGHHQQSVFGHHTPWRFPLLPVPYLGDTGSETSYRLCRVHSAWILQANRIAICVQVFVQSHRVGCAARIRISRCETAGRWIEVACAEVVKSKIEVVLFATVEEDVRRCACRADRVSPGVVFIGVQHRSLSVS